MKTIVEHLPDNQRETLAVENASRKEVGEVQHISDVSLEAVHGRAIRGPHDWEDRYQAYLQKRVANNEFWTDKAIRHGSALEATASTSWLRAASLRRLKTLLSPSDYTLEVGCANGSLLGPLSHSCRAFGVDLTWEMLAVAKRKHSKIKGLVRADACRLPFPDAKFDLFYTSRCLINVLDSDMQSLAIREAFRVTKPDGAVVLIENFEEPVAAMNRAIERWRAGRPIEDEHNLLLSLERTLELGQQAGWRPVRIQGNTLASFLANIVIRKIGPRQGTRIIDRLIYPLYVLLTRIEDRFGSRVPLFGKDTMVLFKRA